MTHLRTRNLSTPVLFVLFMALLGASVASAGVVFEATTTHHDAQGTWTESATWTVDGTNFKIETVPSEGKNRSKNETYFRGDRRELVQVDHAENTYVVIDAESLSAMGSEIEATMKEAMGEVKEVLEELDPEQRKMVEQMLQGEMGMAEDGEVPEAPRHAYRKTEERAEHSGYPCVRWDVTLNDERVGELWITDWDNIEGGKAVRSSVAKLTSFYDELRASIGWARDLTDNNPLSDFAQTNGFPVLARNYDNDKLVSETLLESAQTRELAKTTFAPPTGYRQRTMGPQ